MKVGTDGVLLGAWCHVDGCHRVLDVGTGSGLIALMVAQRSADAGIVGVEIDADAAVEARENVAASPWSDRIEIVEGDFNQIRGNLGKFDLIVSNPPYFMTDIVSPDKSRATARHGHGLDYSDLINAAVEMLTETGSLALVSPANREDDIVMSTAFSGLHINRLTKVFTKLRAMQPTRLLWQISRGGSQSIDSLYVGSEEYRRLTAEFYL
jgi:tRNA1Val (adenine37-N6)-methyltransferase